MTGTIEALSCVKINAPMNAEDIAAVDLIALSAAKARRLLKKVEKVSDIVLELAAGIVYFTDNGCDARAAAKETKARKSVKASAERLREAFSLIRDLGLDPKNELASVRGE